MNGKIKASRDKSWRLSAPEQKCIDWPEQKYISDGNKALVRATASERVPGRLTDRFGYKGAHGTLTAMETDGIPMATTCRKYVGGPCRTQATYSAKSARIAPK